MYNLQAQDTYIKRFVTFDDRFEFSNTIFLSEDHIYLSSRGDCDGNGCAILSRLDYKGSPLWAMKFPEVYGGNSNSLVINDTLLYMGSYESWANDTYQFHLLPIWKDDGSKLDDIKFNYDTLSINGVNSEGLLQFEDLLLQYGEFRDSNSIATGLIQWIDNEYKPIRTTTYGIPGNRAINALQDLQPDGYGNLVFATVFQDGNFMDNTVIRKLDIIGNVIEDVFIPSDDSLDPRPQLAVSNDGNYVFSHKTDRVDEIQGVKVVQLVCSDTTGQVLWTHNYPWKIIGQQPANVSNNVHINQITPTTDGGVIICARVRSNRFLNGFHDDAYIGKFDTTGTLEWERRINFLDDRDTLYDWCSLYDIKERPDGQGYVAVGSYTPSDTSTTSILLVSIDRDGCIEGLECDGDHIVVSTVDQIDIIEQGEDFSIYPNPFNYQLYINIDEPVQLRISDIAGKIIINQKIDGEAILLDTESWTSGLYIVNLLKSDGSHKSNKVIKY